MSLAQLKAKVKYVPDPEAGANYLVLQKTLRRIITGAEGKRRSSIENRSGREYNKSKPTST